MNTVAVLSYLQRVFTADLKAQGNPHYTEIEHSMDQPWNEMFSVYQHPPII